MHVRTIRIIRALCLSTLVSTSAWAQDPAESPDETLVDPAPTAPETKKAVEDVKKTAARGAKSEGRAKMMEMRKKHKALRKTLMDEMMTKVKAAPSKEEKKRIHEEYKGKIKEQNEQFRSEAMAAREELKK